MEITLRRANMADLDPFLAIRNSDFVLRYNCMQPLTAEKARLALAQDAADPHCFYIDLHGRMIGAIYFSQDDLRFGVNALSVSYYLSQDCARQGYMTQALNQALAVVFSEDVTLVSARVFSENTASIQLLKGLGFQQEGFLRHAVRAYRDIVYDDTLWALFKTDFLRRDSA